MNIDLHIEELVLQGFPAARRVPIADAFRTELERLLTARARAEPHAFHAARSVRHGATVRLPAGASDAAIGSRLAYATMRAIDGAGGAPARGADRHISGGGPR